MWCNVCQCDVASEVAADHRRVTCSNCGQVLGETATSQQESSAEPAPDRAREARALLDRWAKNQSFDPYGPPRKSATRLEVDSAPPQSAGRFADADATANEQHSAKAVRAAAPEALTAGAAMTRSEPGTGRSPDSIPPLHGNAPDAFDERPSKTPSFRIDAGIEDARKSDESSGVADRGPGRPSLQSSANELELLTNEILSRVSQLSSARERLRDEHAADSDQSSEAGLPVLPASSRVSEPGNLYRGFEHEEPAAFSDEADDAQNVSSPAGPGAADRVPPESPPRGVPRSVPRETLHAAPVADHEPMVTLRSDQPHVGASSPHVDLSEAAAKKQASQKSRSWYSGIGQALSYLGILLMTGGTAFVISAYFGATTGNAATGWLIATVGQMLLLLGIVTLVSSGMEETATEVTRTVNERMLEVSRQLDLIGDRVIRIEQGSDAGPKRPHFISRNDAPRRAASTVAHDEQAR